MEKNRNEKSHSSQLRTNEVDIDTNLLQSMHIRFGEKEIVESNSRRHSNFMNSNSSRSAASSSSNKWQKNVERERDVKIETQMAC